MMATGHSVLRDRYQRLTVSVQYLVLVGSVWLTAMAFADPTIEKFLSPDAVPPKIWIGILGVLAFVLTLLDLVFDWRKRSERHETAAAEYAAVKIEIRKYLEVGVVDLVAEKSLLDRYDQLGRHLPKIPDKKFLALKKQHKIKVQISKVLDRRPSASIWVIRLMLWCRDNKAVFRGKRNGRA